ncbi:agmatinase family protein [Halarchaeum nitratireducens]|uniref:Agmatinase n=1 Tax=Halarchaeum nitratireducens TaxID=489913 RepID=A0A830G8J3_9EURY|nr:MULTISPECIES: agmatinase family protein [Halarchaeum]MBP2249726.1 agmatinase [Halarchaeum solikamskense]GGN10969.1 agmatinase [Halarchaeum nitratireducens]
MSHEPTDAAYESLPELSFAGASTFLKAPSADPETVDADIAVVGAPYDGAVSRRPGTRYGPKALREASAWYEYFVGAPDGAYNVDTERTVDYGEIEIRDCGDVPVVPNDVDRTRSQIEGYVETVAERAFPVVLGGDHYCTYPAFCGYADAVDADVGLVHLDAHSDTTDDSDLYGEHWHGSPMARIDDSEHGGYENHAMIGLRGYERPAFADLVSDGDVHLDTAADVRERGIDACVADAIEHASDGVDHVYLTVDIDVTDPAFAPGTGTPEFGGISAADLFRAMDLLGDCDAIGAMDLMEVAPGLDANEMTPMLGANAVVRFLESRFL